MREADSHSEAAESLDPLRAAYLSAATGGQADALAMAAKARLLAELDDALSIEAAVFVVLCVERDDGPELVGRDIWRARNGEPDAFAWASTYADRLRSAAASIGPRKVYWAADGQLWSD